MKLGGFVIFSETQIATRDAARGVTQEPIRPLSERLDQDDGYEPWVFETGALSTIMSIQNSSTVAGASAPPWPSRDREPVQRPWRNDRYGF